MKTSMGNKTMQRNRFYRTAQNFLISLGLVIAAASANANEFTNLEKAAKGQTVYFNAWGGDADQQLYQLGRYILSDW